MAVVGMGNLWPVFIFSLILLGIYDYSTNFPGNDCDMTYMYEMPQYIPIKIDPITKARYPRYNLYVYGEGSYAEALRYDRQFSGIPVLFIPGNSGSYKQVRSLASVSYRKATSLRVHFDFFSVDLNEEYSGLYGGVLQEQTEFVQECILEILNLYKSLRSQPKSVVILGHSMGGLIARALFTVPGFDANTVSVIFTQATPHQPSALVDGHMRTFYAKVGSHWRDKRSEAFSHVNLVSIGGGHRDILVRSSLTIVPEDERTDSDLMLFNTAIPGVWLPTDHNAIVWCKQLVLTMSRSLFDMVDHKTRQITTDSMKRAVVLEYHFIRRTSPMPYSLAANLNTTVILNLNAVWTETRKSPWSLVSAKVTAVTYFALPIRRDGILIIVGKHVPAIEWLMVCKAENGHEKPRCTTAQMVLCVQRLKSLQGELKYAAMDLNDWKPNTHAVVQVAPSAQPVQVHSEIYDPAERHRRFHIPWMPLNFVFKSTVLERTARGAVFYNISFVGMIELWQAYSVSIVPFGKKCVREDIAVARFHVPWSSEDIYTPINCKNTTYIVAKMQTPYPLNHSGFPQLHLFLDPQCTYRITLSGSIADTMGQIVRFYWLVFPILIVAVLSETLSVQLSSFISEGRCPPLYNALNAYRGIYKVVIPAHIILYVTRLDAVIEGSEGVFPPLSSYPPETRSIHLSVTLYILYVLTVFMIRGLIILLTLPVKTIGWVFATLLYKYKQQEPGQLRLRQRLVALIPMVVGVALVTCAYSSCGSVALVAGLMFYLLKLSYLQGKFETAENRGRDTGLLSVSAHAHHTLFLLWWLCCLLLVPCLMAWVCNWRFSTNLMPDPSLFPTVILILSLAFLWDDEGTTISRTVCRPVCWTLHLSSIAMLCVALDVLYLVSIFACFTFILFDFLQVASFKTHVD